VLLIIGKKARHAVAVVNDLVTGALEPFDKPGGAQGGGSFSLPREKAAALEGEPIKAIFFG